MASMESSHPGWLLVGLRYVLPAVVTLAGLAIMALGGETNLEGGREHRQRRASRSTSSTGCSASGAAGDHERDAEEAARDYFDRHGRWPVNTPYSGSAAAPRLLQLGTPSRLSIRRM